MQSYHFANKGPYSQSSGFSSSHVQMWELDHKEALVLNNWCFWTVVLENILESPLDYREIKPVNPKGNQPWMFIGRTDGEAPIFWPPDVKSWLIGEDPDAGEIWGQVEKLPTEGEMVEWHHRLNGHEFEQTPGDSKGQGSLMCCGPWGHKRSDTAEWLNYSNKDTSGSKSVRAQWSAETPGKWMEHPWTLHYVPFIYFSHPVCLHHHLLPCRPALPGSLPAFDRLIFLEQGGPWGDFPPFSHIHNASIMWDPHKGSSEVRK